MRAIRIHETGGVDKLHVEDMAPPAPAPGEIRFRVEAVGVNFVDTYKRSGLYPVTLPHTLGQEAAGVVTALGEGVQEFQIGDRVASAAVAGAYAEEAVVPAVQAVPVPPNVDLKLAAAVLLQGMTAHYLAFDTYPLQPRTSALVHAAAGGVGLLLTQIAKRRGARVLATVGSEEKAQLARDAGADNVCIYSREDFTAAARVFTDGRGVDVVYDGVGKSTFEGSLNSLRPRGMLVSFGNASGAVPAFQPLILSQKGSLFFTRPTLAHYTRTQDELRLRTRDLFVGIADGTLHVRVGKTFPLEAAGDAHRALEGRETTGKVLLLP